jgi:hypothetical protein
MNHHEVRDLLVRHLSLSAVDPNRAHEIYSDDAILEFPQSAERFRGKANIQGFREQYPAKVTYQLRSIRGSGDIWIGEGRAFLRRHQRDPFRVDPRVHDGLVERETIYFADPFTAPDWRKPWAEEGAVWEAQDDLPARLPADG